LPFGIDLKLGPLADNGGPTKTRMPAADSPLVNHGSNPYGLRYDQRGYPFKRVQGPRADIGAVERPQPAPTPFAFTPKGSTDPFDGPPSNEDNTGGISTVA
jgi:hypothetical protein